MKFMNSILDYYGLDIIMVSSWTYFNTGVSPRAAYIVYLHLKFEIDCDINILYILKMKEASLIFTNKIRNNKMK